MKTEPLQIWTIGHSTRSLEEFVVLLQGSKIEALADVRLFPGSRRYPHFNAEPFSKSLGDVGIEYIHFPELGGRRKPTPDSINTAWRNEAFRGYADYMMTVPFQNGIKRLLKIAATKRTAVMCAEAVWWSCHRSLISDFLKAQGHTVCHILSATKVDEHPFTSAARMVDGKLSYRAPTTPLEFEFGQAAP